MVELAVDVYARMAATRNQEIFDDGIHSRLVNRASLITSALPMPDANDELAFLSIKESFLNSKESFLSNKIAIIVDDRGNIQGVSGLDTNAAVVVISHYAEDIQRIESEQSGMFALIKTAIISVLWA